MERDQNQKTKFAEGPKPKNEKSKNSNLKITILPFSSFHHFI